MHQKIKIIPMKIHKTVATTAAPFGSDMHQIPLAGLRGPTSKGRRGEGREGGGEGGGGEGKGKGRRGKGPQGKFKSSTGREERGREGKKGKGSVLPQCSLVPPNYLLLATRLGAALPTSNTHPLCTE